MTGTSGDHDHPVGALRIIDEANALARLSRLHLLSLALLVRNHRHVPSHRYHLGGRSGDSRRHGAVGVDVHRRPCAAQPRSRRPSLSVGSTAALCARGHGSQHLGVLRLLGLTGCSGGHEGDRERPLVRGFGVNEARILESAQCTLTSQHSRPMRALTSTRARE